jgi:hypothetical protein
MPCRLPVVNTGDRSLDPVVIGYVGPQSGGVPEPSLIVGLTPLAMTMVWRRV